MIDYPIPVLGFCAYSGTGKTTLLKSLLPRLREKGLRIGIIKHTHHDFDIDHPGKDSYELRHAGAASMLIASSHRSALIEEHPKGQADPTLHQALQSLDHTRLDAVLVEGFKQARFPKIELIRKDSGRPPQYPQDSDIIAVATDAKDLPGQPERNITFIDLNDRAAIIDFLLLQLDRHKASPHKIERLPSCSDDFEPGTLTVQQARDAILKAISPITETESMPVNLAVQRTLSEDICSELNIPGHTNSAVDGYALKGSELPENDTRQFTLTGSAMAGEPFTGNCLPGQCVRIMTGAVMPENTDTVIMQEHVRRDENSITIDASHKAGQNVRQAGEDIAIGDTVLTQGRVLTPADLGILASLGKADIEVIRKPVISFMSTGNELMEPRDNSGQNQHGHIYDSNRYTLSGMLERLNVTSVDLGIVRDDPGQLTRALNRAAEQSDVIITSGGVSVGEADYIKEILQASGEVHFWKIAMKPGRPLTFGRFNDTLFFGLPGNPVAVMVTFYQFVKPAIEYLASGATQTSLTLPARCESSIRKIPGRYEFVRGVFGQSADGQLTVHKTGQQGSGILTSMSEANCFILLDEDRANITPGEAVRIQPFDSLI